ncbi:hypothetical protein CARUB_v10007261mg [Capsella rubella]|uniref:Uncharacterized protein n=1 Tax=Capsella rubella TaxID=81985 RepID=R0FAD7_9BRAS|nr:hypothetical protein CARUB_v10007261mg [Capsella rubella]
MTTDFTIVHESPSLLRVWWMNKNLRYDVAMSSIIIILNIAAIVYMITHKIPLSRDTLAIENNILALKATTFGRIYHLFGFCVFLELLYLISPPLALHFGLPCLLYSVAVIIAPGCPHLWKGLCNRVQELRDWWKHVNQPQSSVVNV